MNIALSADDLVQIKEELMEYGFIKKHKHSKKQKIKSKPFHYISSDGYDMYVGKNNYQNDELSIKFANGGDMWFHAKKMPGSHVIVRMEGAEELPDQTYESEEAGRSQTGICHLSYELFNDSRTGDPWNRRSNEIKYLIFYGG